MPESGKIDPAEYQKRLERMSEILSGIAVHADEQAKHRCPYRNRLDQCTARFGCRNQRRPAKKGELLLCGGDRDLDYRNAWETSALPLDEAPPGQGSAVHDGEARPLRAGLTLFDHADDLQVQVPTSCGRSGHCHECIVEVRSGMDALCPPTDAESFLRPPYRLACQAKVEDAEARVEFAPLRRTPKILTLSTEKPVELDPAVVRRGEAVYRGEEEIDRYRGHLYGLAIDLGTTTVVLDLVDLETGKSVHLSSFESPQRFGGSDIMHRISYDGEHPGELRKAVVNALNHEIQALCQRYRFARQELYEVVVAGNSTMRDIFFRLDVQSIGQKPYKSLVEREYREGLRESTSLQEKTRRLGLRANPKARAYSLPLIASHVGADVAADLAAIDMDAQDQVVMLVDVGTNTEVVVGHAGRMIAASCPAGPAFEGGEVTYGMPGYEGAIETLRRSGEGWEYRTIGNAPAQGICGSGLIDLLAELRRHGLMQPKGIFADKAYELEIVPERGITFSRRDASTLAQAKAANYCGQYIALRAFGVDPADLHALYLAGGFANYVDVGAAIEIGFLAPVPAGRVHKVGNASIQGAREVLLSQKRRQMVEELVRNIEHIELETTPDFFDLFVEGCQFKPMPERIPPLS